jgi:dihydroflavonol-4-reductase
VDFLNGRRPSYLTGGINFVAVSDVAQGHVLAARRGRLGGRYILGNTRGNLSLDDFLRLLAQVSGQVVPPPEPLPWRARWRRRGKPRLRRGKQPPGFKPAALTANPQKAIRELGLPQTPLTDAFAEAVAWFKANGYVLKYTSRQVDE